MYPHERSLVKRLAGTRFALLGINSDRDKDALKTVREEENITWRSFWNGPEGTNGPISKRWNVRGWPTLYVLDVEGKIRYKSLGSPGDATIDKWIETLLVEAGEKLPEAAGTE
ncbi:MAG TPA: thioredoxin-like domain-containing protein [Pirellulales bacterium]|jgi:hypothetical protein|nr:thioredoxin-like domain-containing protein [Pirellulales bacterium]